MKPVFIGECDLRMHPNGRDATVLSDFCYRDSDGELYCALEGDLINGASIPRFFWRLVGAPYTGKHRRAAAIHDSEYIRKVKPREVVDKAFLKAMKLDRVSWWKRHVFYRLVKRFGQAAWDDDD